jgi:hypothetical protein
VSGDGGFLFTATELETAKRIGSRLVQLIWNSGSYDMVAFQEQAHDGRTAGVQLGAYDVPSFAAAFGCKGYRIESAEELGPVLREALRQSVPVLIDIPIDYSQNLKLMEDVYQEFIIRVACKAAPGTLVGFWSPLEADALTVELHSEDHVLLALPDTPAFLAADLCGDPSASLARAEGDHP